MPVLFYEQAFSFLAIPSPFLPVSRLMSIHYLYSMTKLRKIALIGIASAFVLTILAVIYGFPPAVAGVHALPFCMLLIIDMSRKKEEK